MILLKPHKYKPVKDVFLDNYFYINITRNPIKLDDQEVVLLDRTNIEDIVFYDSEDSPKKKEIRDLMSSWTAYFEIEPRFFPSRLPNYR